MHTSDFDYHLPQERIAQRPECPRDASRLMVLDRKTETIEHRIFRDLPQFLNKRDVLVLNETRVLPARLRGVKIPSGGQAEILLLKRHASQKWETLVGGRGLKPGKSIELAGGIVAEIKEDLGGGRRIVHFNHPVTPALEKIGEMPLPPYIHTPLRDPQEYQTVFAKQTGSTAAPTAGLHFTPTLLSQIVAKGVEVIKITLHVGLDTFAPVLEDDPAQHPIHSEWCQVSPGAAEAINSAREKGGKVFAVGTTTVRALETAVRDSSGDRTVEPFEGPTDLFILPGYEFRVVDAMVTNFHLPRSTLVMMVSAFAGWERILDAYELAKREGYRFYSFGDAMLIL